jgi:hypothetical protein
MVDVSLCKRCDYLSLLDQASLLDASGREHRLQLNDGVLSVVVHVVSSGSALGVYARVSVLFGIYRDCVL